ncbi:hypothetical protein I5R65_07595 [Herbaspirillum sp. AP02]|uniref:hypothetical protein n=1 Tax=unclassified Herbaspirillum TaxID=2624150 RepID=UPI0015DAC02A|nr:MULTISPECIES: hypothetical protein [unclassified Herbaspirillum]MBG7619323.1 hypothetical protein [Herbaspirillum sp. AP02]NZD66607.1 hypothetical protein [Herbaspirillum sp. AP21]
MSRLIEYRQWLRIDEAADYIGKKWGERILEKDVLRLALDSRLRLSAIFGVGQYARAYKLVSEEVASNKNYEGIFYSPSGETLALASDIFELEDDTPYDLLQMSGDAVSLIKEYSTLSGYPPLPHNLYTETVVSDGYNFFQLTEFPDLSGGETPSLSELPRSALLVVRTNELRQFLNEVSVEPGIATQTQTASSAPHPTSKPLGNRERETLLKIILGMAIKGYAYDPDAKRSSIAKEISEDLQKLGMSIDDDTVRNHLNRAKDIFGKPNSEK